MKLKHIAHIRTGDKGNLCNICVIPYQESDYSYLKEILTTTVIKDFYSEICLGIVERYCIDSLFSLNFVLHNALNGGVSKSLCIDKHGKSFGMALLDLEIKR